MIERQLRRRPAVGCSTMAAAFILSVLLPAAPADAQQTSSIPLATIGAAPRSGTLPNGVGWTVNTGSWIPPQGYAAYPPATQQWTFNQTVSLRFGIAGLNLSNECVQVPVGTVAASINPAHTWNPATQLLCRTGASGAGNESTFTLAGPVTGLALGIFARTAGLPWLGPQVLAAAACGRWLWRRAELELGAVPVLAAIAAIALICALSPERTIFGWRIVRPSAALFDLAPMFRSYARFSVVVQLMTAILAGVGAHVLWQSRAVRARAAVVALLALTVFEYAPWPWQARDVLPTSGHHWLAAQSEPRRVFDCSPPNFAEHDTAWLAVFAIDYPNRSAPDCGEPALGWKLGAAGLTHLIVRPDRPEWTRLIGHPPAGLRATYRAGDSAVFEVAASHPLTFVGALSGWYPREYDGERTWRWSSGVATLTLVNPGAQSRSVVIALELSSFGTPRYVSVSVSDAPVADLFVDAAPAVRRVGPFLLPPGRTVLTLRVVNRQSRLQVLMRGMQTGADWRSRWANGR